MNRKSVEDRKRQATNIHNNKYDYSLWPDHVSLGTIVTNICTIHGPFSHTLKQHTVLKSGCPNCAGRNISTEDRKLQAANIHNNKYDYSLWPTNPLLIKNTKVQNICAIHGIFEQTLNTHIHRKCGCPGCVLDKQQACNTKKYGVDHHKKQHFSAESLTKIHDRNWLYEQHVTAQRSQLDIATELNINITTIGKYLNKYGIEKQYGMGSIPQHNLAEWVKTLGVDVLENTRTVIAPYELDIYLPNNNLAIEYCGLYWHSEQAGKDKWYHKKKYTLCKDKGIRLLTIFEDEWLTRQDVVKSKIRSVLNSDWRPKIMARKCSVVQVNKKTKKEFFEKYHIQGNGPSGLDYALVCEDEFVAIAGFIKTGTEYILNRYATSCHVIGGFSKLIAHFRRNNCCSKLTTFADLRWSVGNLYKQTGWLAEKVLPPEYCYSSDAVHRDHKFNYRRKMLPSKLKSFVFTSSEKQNCNNNGILRIWDCGKIKFVSTHHK